MSLAQSIANGEAGSSVRSKLNTMFGELFKATYASAKIYYASSVAEIEAAVADIQAGAGGCVLNILPGDYNLKSPYRKRLEANSNTAETSITNAFDRYAVYISVPNVTIQALIPGTVRFFGEATAIVHDTLPSTGTDQNHTWRGGMIYIHSSAPGFKLIGIDIDGAVDVQATFDKNLRCHTLNTGQGCWDVSHKGVYSFSPDAELINCTFRRWAGEMIYGGHDGIEYKLKIIDCKLLDNQVSTISGNWNLTVEGCEFYNLSGQCFEGLNCYNMVWRNNRFYDCSGGGINILGPVASLAPAGGWWVRIHDNLFENFTSDAFGAIFVSKQTTPDTTFPRNIQIKNNTFRNCRLAMTASLGGGKEVHFTNNDVINDGIALAIGIQSSSGPYVNSVFAHNTFILTQIAKDAGHSLRAANLSTGSHANTRFIGNYYENCETPYDAINFNLQFFDEKYNNVVTNSTQRFFTFADPSDALFDQSTGYVEMTFTGAAGPFYLRLATVDGSSNPLYTNGTELTINGHILVADARAAFLIDGRGCRLKDGWPVLLQGRSDYIRLRYDSTLKSWLEYERSTPQADDYFRLSHRGPAASKPDFTLLPNLVVATVAVLKEAFYGWEYYETDTNKLVVYTATGWLTIWENI